MNYFKRAQIYKASNVTFDPKKVSAFSYDWWEFVSVIEGKIVFNNYRYSVSTGKHQHKVRRLMRELGIKEHFCLPCPVGLQKYSNLQDLIVDAEEHLCDQFLNEMLKQQDRYQRQKQKKFAKKLENYLEDSVCFRDYDIEPVRRFGAINKIAVHQKVDPETMESDVRNAVDSFQRDGFGSIIFYVEGEPNYRKKYRPEPQKPTFSMIQGGA